MRAAEYLYSCKQCRARLSVHYRGWSRVVSYQGLPGTLGMECGFSSQPVGSVEKSETRRPPGGPELWWWSKEVLNSETLDCSHPECSECKRCRLSHSVCRLVGVAGTVVLQIEHNRPDGRVGA